MTEHPQIPQQLSFDFPNAVPVAVLPLVMGEAALAKVQTLIEVHTPKNYATIGSASIFDFSKFRSVAKQSSTAQLYEEIFESIKHIG